MAETATITKVKLALRVVTTSFDTEISDLIDAALDDLGIAGVDGTNAVETDPLVLRAITTYCRVNFGSPDDYDRVKASYDEQKAQLSMATNYTTWSASEDEEEES